MANEIIYDGLNIDDIQSIDDLKNPYEGNTPFYSVYERFLSKITDDMYCEFTPEDTLRDLQNLLVNAIPGFEFPRKAIDQYVLEMVEMPIEQVGPFDFIIGSTDLHENMVLVERSYFVSELSNEEINILAILMMEGWVQRQVTSIEHTRMKYSGPDFKMTSQANHLAKLLNLLKEIQRQSLHMQRLYKRRKVDNTTGLISSNWGVFREVSTFDD